MRILIVEDDPDMNALLVRGLAGEGHDVETALDGRSALRLADAHDPELVVLDLMIPGISGIEVARALRDARPEVDILMLTALGATEDRVTGLDAGADDYMVKPFEFAELAARIRAAERRRGLARSPRVAVGDLLLDPDAHRATIGERVVALSPTEWAVLRELAATPGVVVERETLLTQVWGTGHVDGNVVDQYVSYLRRKLQHAESTVRIDTVRGVGFVARVAEAS